MATAIAHTKTTTTVQLSGKDVEELIINHFANLLSTGEYHVDFDVSSSGIFRGAVVTHKSPTMETVTEL